MNANVATEKSIAHRGSSGLFVEKNRYQSATVKEFSPIWHATAIKSYVKTYDHQAVGSQLRKSPNVDRQNPDGNSALHYAAFNGELGNTRLLLAVGADVNISNLRGDTPLTCAAYNGHCNVIMGLVAAGAELNAQDEDGRTALTWAVIRGQTDVVRLMITLGADLAICDNIDNSPLLWSIILNYRELCEILIEAEERLGVRS